MSLTSEENDFRCVLSAMIASLGKTCNERDLRRVYQEEEGSNVDITVRKVEH